LPLLGAPGQFLSPFLAGAPLFRTEAKMLKQITEEARAKMAQSKLSRQDIDRLIASSDLPQEGPDIGKIARRVGEMPATCRRNYLQAMSGKSLAAGVKAFCLECIGWDRSEVTACTAPACPLHPYRPFQ